WRRRTQTGYLTSPKDCSYEERLPVVIDLKQLARREPELHRLSRREVVFFLAAVGRRRLDGLSGAEIRSYVAAARWMEAQETVAWPRYDSAWGPLRVQFSRYGRTLTPTPRSRLDVVLGAVGRFALR